MPSQESATGMIASITGAVALIAASFYAGYVTGLRRREEKYLRALLIVEERIRQAEGGNKRGGISSRP